MIELLLFNIGDDIPLITLTRSIYRVFTVKVLLKIKSSGSSPVCFTSVQLNNVVHRHVNVHGKNTKEGYPANFHYLKYIVDDLHQIVLY